MVNTNVVYCGDCLTILKEFPSECVDLIYLDPPFFSNRHYEVIWGNHSELRAFGDRWKGGINHYIQWMGERLEQCERVLKKTGSIYLHCDWHASHYLKVKMDKIFSENNFRNEIIWSYMGGGSSKDKFGRRHDAIFFYVNGKKYYFNPDDIRIPYTSAEGRKTKWAWGHHKGTEKVYKPHPLGKVPEDVWLDIPPINSMAKERLGYPTQKPEALLDRIIRASSKKDDIILDPMVGGGTTIAVAHKLGRKWIGIDVSPTACRVVQKRMKKLGVAPVVLGLPNSIEELKKLPPFEFQNWVCKQLNGRNSDKKSSDMGIDGYTFDKLPIQVKQSDGIGRNVVDNFETAIKRVDKKKGVIVAFSFGKGAIEEVARAKENEGINIRLITVEEMLKADFKPMTLFSLIF